MFTLAIPYTCTNLNITP